nr:DUF2491 family protein [Atlantibacter sp.]
MTACDKGPLGLHLNAGFEIDTVDFRLLGDSYLIEIPSEDYTIAATGFIDMGAGCNIYRYYTSGDEFLQINTTGGKDDSCIEDIKFFVYSKSAGISTREAWHNAIDAKTIGEPNLNWGGKTWQRVFNPLENKAVEPIYLLENVENSDRETWELNNFCMLYQRNVNADCFEYLLISGEETFNEQQEPEWLISWSLGVDISRSGLQVIG